MCNIAMHANIILKVQGDAKHQFARAIKLAVNSTRAHVTCEDKAADLRLEHEDSWRESWRLNVLSSNSSKTLPRSRTKSTNNLGPMEVEQIKQQFDGLAKVDTAHLHCKTRLGSTRNAGAFSTDGWQVDGTFNTIRAPCIQLRHKYSAVYYQVVHLIWQQAGVEVEQQDNETGGVVSTVQSTIYYHRQKTLWGHLTRCQMSLPQAELEGTANKNARTSQFINHLSLQTDSIQALS